MNHQLDRILNFSRFHSLPDEELHYYIMSDFEAQTYYRPRIGSFLLKDLFLNLFNSYSI